MEEDSEAQKREETERWKRIGRHRRERKNGIGKLMLNEI